MLSESTIAAVRNADIIEVIGAYIKLDRHNKACCPFHEEKTPSFSVDHKKQIYKCFGCGVGGDAIRFVMDHDKIDFISAVEKIAGICNITVDYEKVDKEEVKRQRDEKKECNEVLSYAIKKYREILWKQKPSRGRGGAWQYITTQRHLSEEALTKWQIGYAPAEWRTITPDLINSGKYKPALEIGIIKTSNGKNFDAYRNRIIIPIKNHRGEYVGLGGRLLPELRSDLPPAGGTEGGQGGAKYINSPESKLYQKSRVLFGLYEAEKAIRVQNKAILVEGYMDVIALHENGFENTVATCGTSLTTEQAKLLKRYTSHVVIIRDGDAAGRKALERDVPVLLEQNFKINAIILEDGEDPDTLVNGTSKEGILPLGGTEGGSLPPEGGKEGGRGLQELLQNPEDAIMLLADEWINQAGDDLYEASDAIISVLDLLTHIPSSLLQKKYLEKICKANRWKQTDIRKQFDELLKEKANESAKDEDDPYKGLPEDVDRNDVIRFGFFEQENKSKTGYYFLNGDGGSGHQLTNFVIKPLYHIYSPIDNRRMIAINNGYYERILDMPSDKMLSVEYICGRLYEEGNFVPKEGFTKTHLYKILNKISDHFPLCYEIKKLGWQPEGFFAFNNYVYQPANEDQEKKASSLRGERGGLGSLEEYNEYGIVKVGDQMFLSPSISKTNELVRDGEDNIFENDQYLTFKESAINFEQWAQLMEDVYGQNSWMAIPFAVATIMRDIIRSVTKIPHLYLYGQVGSGKSEFGESIFYLFFSGKNSQGELYKPMNLNQGTDYAFFNRMERFVNVPNALNEFDENAIPDEWFRAIKSSYDGEGREKGRKERNRATVQQINCTLILMGQYLGTKDDNSVLTRSLPLPLRKVDNRPEDQVNAFYELKEQEKRGLSGILLEMMDWRPLFKKKFAEEFFRIAKQLKERSSKEGIPPEGGTERGQGSIPDRLVKNVACMITTVNLICEKIKLPFSKEDYYSYARDFMNNMAALIVKTSGISEFWSMMEYLLDRSLITEGFDFFIEARSHVILRPSRDKEFRKEFPSPVKLLFLRLNNIHKLYRENSRKTGSDAGFNESTLLLYMKEQPYYVGQAKTETFTTPEGKRIRTSCIVVQYDKLDINLERTAIDSPEDRTQETLFGEVIKDAEETSRKGIFKFILSHIRRKEIIKESSSEGIPPEGGTEGGFAPMTEYLYTTCFTDDPTIMWEAQKDKRLQVTGMVSIHQHGKREHRTMDITEWKAERELTNNENNEEELPF